MVEIELCCPYCGLSFCVEPPVFTGSNPKKMTSVQSRSLSHAAGGPVSLSSGVDKGIDENPYLENPQEPAKCLPYTRDVGRFDPEPDEENFLSGRYWSRIGKDYLKFINFEQIGILRISREKIDVQYRAQKCPQCGELFDVFANYTRNISLKDLWPHLFSPRGASEQGIALYKGENLITYTIGQMTRIVRSSRLGIFVLCMLIFFGAWAPFLIANNMGIPSFREISTALQQSKALTVPLTAVLYGSISIGLFFLLDRFVSYLAFLRDTGSFEGLFKVVKPQQAVTYWKNYVSARFVGVQSRGSGLPRLTQSDVFAGGIAVLLGLLSWSHSQWPELWKALHAGEYLNAFFMIDELLVWLLIIYVVSEGIFLAMSLSFYVLNGIGKIPMNISPFENFLSSRPLKTIESYAVNVMLIVFILAVIILSFMQFALPIEWVVDWFEVAMALLFVVISFGLGRSEYLLGGLIYFALLSGSTMINTEFGLGISTIRIMDGFFKVFNQPSVLAFSLDMRIIILGLFLTGLLAFQLRMSGAYVKEILLRARDAAIKTQKKQLGLLESNLEVLNDSISLRLVNNQLLDQIELQAQRNSVISSMEATIRIMSQLEKTDIPRTTIKNLFKAVAPFLVAILTQLLDSGVSAILNQIQPKLGA